MRSSYGENFSGSCSRCPKTEISSHRTKPDSDSAAADLGDAGTVEGEEALPSRPGCSSTITTFAAFMRFEYSVLQAEAVQRLPASSLPLWPMQMTHGEAMPPAFRFFRQRGILRFFRQIKRFLWTLRLDEVDMSGHIQTCLDIQTCLVMSGHVWICPGIGLF